MLSEPEQKEVRRQPKLYLAHVKQDQPGNWRIHSLHDHLVAVAEIAQSFAAQFNSDNWACYSGIWHDLGKFNQEFQEYIQNASGYNAEAHIESMSGKGRVDHSAAGAQYAVEKLGMHGKVLAYLIAGHHAGLPDYYKDEASGGSLQERLSNISHLQKALNSEISETILHPRIPQLSLKCGREGFALWTRMLFSCLVDADFLDTESFMDAEKAATRQAYPNIALLLEQFNSHMQQLAATASDTNVNRIRSDVLRQCRAQALLPSGLFSLTVPTGGGKTLSSMAFALEHAVKYNKKRIIYAIPYTSIIEQTADIFRAIFPDAVIEHHSNLDPDSKETAQSRLAAENWDAPIIVTTNVQLFESLFAARTSRCRKLHNLANSIIVLDEAQLIPPEFLEPILQTLNLLTQHYGVTIVLSTATQPAFKPRDYGGKPFKGLQNVTEIINMPEALYRQLQRVQVVLPSDLQQAQTWSTIAEQLTQHRQVLAIVNRRQDAKELALLIPDALHLSANLCGAHRSRLISEIKLRLKNNEPIRVISTQLIEAGVDVDFPVVYRALAGLDSIAQAAGRCNREGKLADIGQVYVFVPQKPAPSGLLRKGEDAARGLLYGLQELPLTPDRFEQYFELYYASLNNLDANDILSLQAPDDNLGVQFRTVADRFRLIDDAQQVSIAVHYGDAEKWLNTLKKQGPDTWLLRKLQRYLVSIPRYQLEQLKQQGAVTEIYPDIYAQAIPGLYHERYGLSVNEEPMLNPSSLIF